ncbi:MAG TPA: hypothetical protein VNA20_13285 [Frankiaceae bacterium]|nr:hypothetical protein [Frankiaceae bacterium]
MTEPPAEPTAPDRWAGQPGWGVDPAPRPGPASNPYAPGPPAGWGPDQWQNYPPLPRRPWYRAPGSLIGAATFSAVCAWLTLVAALLARQIIVSMESADAFEALLYGLLAMVGLAVVGAIGLATFVLTVGGVVATVPLAVVWFRDPDRSAGAGLALAHAVVSWAALAAAIVWIPA